MQDFDSYVYEIDRDADSLEELAQLSGEENDSSDEEFYDFE